MTSIRNISQGVGYYEGLKWREPNPKTISTILKWLEKQNMITIDRGKGNRQYTLITLLNWDLYQSVNGEGNRKVTDNGEGKKQLTDINKNDKEGSKNDKEQIPYAAIVDHLNSKTGKNYKPTARKTKELIRARWNEGYSIEDFHKVIDVCSQKWKGKTFSNGVYGDEYLRPSTLFNGKFDERLNWSIDSDEDKKVTVLDQWKSDSIKPDKSLFKISGGGRQ